MCGSKLLRSPRRTVRFKGKRTYSVDWSSPLYVRGLLRVYALDEREGTMMKIGAEGTSALTPEELDVIVGTKIVRELASSVTNNLVDMLIPILLGAVAGFLAAWIIAGIYYQEQINSLMDTIKDLTIPHYPGLSLARLVLPLVLGLLGVAAGVW